MITIFSRGDSTSNQYYSVMKQMGYKVEMIHPDSKTDLIEKYNLRTFPCALDDYNTVRSKAEMEYVIRKYAERSR